MNNYAGDGYNPHCYLHPKEMIVGICAVCLRERLLNLSAKQGNLPISKNCSNRAFRLLRRRPKFTLTKIFVLGSFLGRHELNHHDPDHNSDQDSIASLEDSFISMKLENNGQESWESKKEADISKDLGKEMKTTEKSTMVQHVEARGSLRWQKRIGQLLHLARWKGSRKGGGTHVAIVSKVEGRRRRRRGWIRSLMKSRTTDQ